MMIKKLDTSARSARQNEEMKTKWGNEDKSDHAACLRHNKSSRGHIPAVDAFKILVQILFLGFAMRISKEHLEKAIIWSYPNISFIISNIIISSPLLIFIVILLIMNPNSLLKKDQNGRSSQQPQLQPRRCQELQVRVPGLRGPWVMMTMTTMMMLVVAIMMMMSSAPRRWSAEHLCRYYVLQNDHNGD